MAFDNILKSIISDFSEDKSNFLYISLPKQLIEETPDLLKDTSFSVINLTRNFAPIKPFMQILKECNPSEEIINQNSYSLQQETIQEYLLNGKAKERRDFINHEEVFFEKTRITQTVSTIIRNLCDKNYVIQNAQELSIEAIEIIKSLEKHRFNGKIIFCFDNEKIENSSTELQAFIDEKHKQNNFYEITNNEKFESKELSIKESVPTFDILYNSLRDCRLLFSLDQGKTISKWIISNIDSLKFSKNQKRLIHYEIAIISYLLSDTDEASYYLNNVLEDQEHEDEELIISALLYMAKVLSLKNASASALKYIKHAMQKLENKKDSDFYALAFMIYYEITERMDSSSSLNNYNEAQRLLKSRNLLNNKMNSSLIMPWHLVDDEKERKKLLPIIEESIEYAKQIDNKFALSTAYHWKGMLISDENNAEETLSWYSQCNEIRTQIGEVASIIKIRNGLSYEYLIRSEYKKSYDLINSFLNRITEINDYPEIIITLNNVGKTLFYSRHFNEAYEIFQKVLHLLHLFNLEEATYYSFLPEYNDVSAYKAIVDFIRNDDIHAKITLNNILNNGRRIAPSVEPFIDFMNAIVSVREDKIEDAENYFSDCENKFIKLGTNNLHCLCFFCYEFAHNLKKSNNELLSEKYVNLGFEYAKKNNLSNFLDYNDKLSLKHYVLDLKEFDSLNINLEELSQKAEKERLMIQLHKRLRDSQFLNKIMTYSSDKLSKSNYIKNVIQAIFDHTMAEAVYIAEKDDNQWNLLDSVSRTEENIPSNELWEDFYNESTLTDKGKLFFNKEKNIIFGNISKFGFEGAVIIVPSQNTMFESDDYDTINIAISNLQSHIVMIKQNEHLMFLSSTDQLSQLKNRHALQEQLSIQSEMIRRYNNKRAMHFQMTIIFLDMDNFKFYNDTYGHEAGDLLISKFGELLKKVFRKVDFISRFGGDEFVILLPNTNCPEAHRAAERVHEALEESNYFITDLEDLLGKKLDVPENRILGFSTGICSNFDIENPTDMETVMNNADQALYYSKQTQKGSITIWSDIKHLLPQLSDLPKPGRE